MNTETTMETRTITTRSGRTVETPYSDEEALARLRIAVNDPEAPVPALMEQIRRVPRETAMLVAALILTSKPLNTITDVLKLASESLPMEEILHSTPFNEILSFLGGSSGRRKPELDFRESLALTLLADRVSQFRSGHLAHAGYFASPSARVVYLLREEKFRELFTVAQASSPELPSFGTERPETVFRTSEYLICRGTFRCLRRQSDSVIQSAEDGHQDWLTLDSVAACAEELTSILRHLHSDRPDPDGLFRLERVPMGGVTLSATVEYLKSLASLESIWLADSGRALRELCRKARYGDVEEFVITNYEEMIVWTQRELAHQTRSIATWRNAYDRFVARRGTGD